MKFAHADPDFADLVEAAADRTGILRAFVEKDYWVVHTLWALHRGAFDVWFKGGTSLAKGFGLIQRFSEDLDLKVLPVDDVGAPAVNWKKDKPQHIEGHKAWYRWVGNMIDVPGATVDLDEQPWSADGPDRKAMGAIFHVNYPSTMRRQLPPGTSPFVKLEVGDARVVPFVVGPVSSFVHDHMARLGLTGQYLDNRPAEVRLVHPWVTLLEKLNAIGRRYPDGRIEARRFVRHYEDAARIVLADVAAPDGYTVQSLAVDIFPGEPAAIPGRTHPALTLPDAERRREVQRAYDDLAGMCWGERLSLDEACAILRNWLAQNELGV
jgi:hypothetical protein